MGHLCFFLLQNRHDSFSISNTIIEFVELEAVVEKSTSTQLHFQFHSMFSFLASDDRAKMPSCTDTTSAESAEALKYILMQSSSTERTFLNPDTQ